MINDKEQSKPVHDENKAQNKDAAVKPEPETLHTPDPQENMEGPVSSLMQKTGKIFDSNESQEEADDKREKNM